MWIPNDIKHEFHVCQLIYCVQKKSEIHCINLIVYRHKPLASGLWLPPDPPPCESRKTFGRPTLFSACPATLSRTRRTERIGVAGAHGRAISHQYRPHDASPVKCPYSPSPLLFLVLSSIPPLQYQHPRVPSVAPCTPAQGVACAIFKRMCP